MDNFDPSIAFSRNLGWTTAIEQQALANKRVAIAGVGGVGGHYCEVLARLGVRKFNIADFDQFELANFNRQNGSGLSTIGRSKIDVIKKRILDINPTAEIRVFEEGILPTNINEFLHEIDLYLDGLDFFVLTQRVLLFRRLHELNIPALTVAPVGMGAALIVFNSTSMTFEKYFGFDENTPDPEKAVRFLVGLAPTLPSRHYQADSSYSNFLTKKVPSLPMGCYLCAGVAGTTALKILLQRGPIKGAPWSLHFDAYLQSYTKRYTWLGSANPIQKIKLIFLRKMLLTYNREKRVSVKLAGHLESTPVEVINVSRGGLAIATTLATDLPELSKIRVKINPSEFIDLKVKKAWSTDHKAGLQIISAPHEWAEYVSQF
jgi:molybdopterin/thiamine biosynthesis adenylyltransferase